MDELGKIAEVNGMEEIPSYLASTVQLAYDAVEVARFGKNQSSDDLKERAKSLTPLGITLNLTTAPNLKAPEGYTIQNRRLGPIEYFSSLNNVPPQLDSQFVNNNAGLHSNQSFGTTTVKTRRKIEPAQKLPGRGSTLSNTALAPGYVPSTIRANPYGTGY